MPKLISAAVLIHFFLACASADVVIQWVNVGNPGNAADTTGFGSVSHSYRISRHEVTNTQYTEFLNAVAGTDTHGLYNASMGSNSRGGITQSCDLTGCSYSVKGDMGDKPVNYVSFWDAARFSNWLHNGQPTGMQDNSTTEDGAYTLDATNPLNSSVGRNAGASVFLPTENEWYKAAFHMNDGVTGNFFEFPTSSDTAPSLATANATGDVANPGANIANVERGADWNGLNGNLTTVGSATSVSPYGTFDQAGNVWEWNETLVTSFSRGRRGGSYSTGVNNSAATNRLSSSPSDESVSIGFRVASVPEPSSLLYLGLILLGIGTAKRLKSGVR